MGTADRGPGGLRLLRGLFRENWRPIAFTYSLYNVESLLHLAQPLVLGLAINGLLRGEAGGLGPMLGQHVVWMGVATGRRLYDTRAFTRIYADTAARLVCRQRGAGVAISAVAARSALAREVVDFFEHDLKGVFAAAYGVAGALAMLSLYDPAVAGLCLLTLAPLAALNAHAARRSYALNGSLNDRLEQEVGVIEAADPAEVAGHYRQAARWHVRLSDLEAWNFFKMEFFILALIAASLARYCTAPGVSPGDIYAVFAYVMRFVGGLDTVPEVTQQLARLKDIGERLAAGEGEAPAP